MTFIGLELWLCNFVVSFNGDFYFCNGVEVISFTTLVFIVFKFYFLGVVIFIVLSILLFDDFELVFETDCFACCVVNLGDESTLKCN